MEIFQDVQYIAPTTVTLGEVMDGSKFQFVSLQETNPKRAAYTMSSVKVLAKENRQVAAPASRPEPPYSSERKDLTGSRSIKGLMAERPTMLVIPKIIQLFKLKVKSSSFST